MQLAIEQLTAEQCNALERGAAVPVVLGGIECVVLRRDAHERLRSLSYDDSEPDPRAFYPVVGQIMADDDAEDSSLDAEITSVQPLRLR